MYLELYVSRVSGFMGFSDKVGNSKIALLGFPFDSTVTGRPGARFGPEAVRKASMDLESLSLRTGIDVKKLPICDLGNLHVVPGNVKESLRRLNLVLRELYEADLYPVVIGGEHTLTIATVTALKEVKKGKIGVLVFDAHGDLRDEFLGEKLSNATVCKRLVEKLGKGSLTLVGVRTFSPEELKAAKKGAITLISVYDVLNDPDKAVERCMKSLEGKKFLYVSIDLDVLDPSCAPGVTSPVPEGLSVKNLLDFLERVLDERVLGFDLCELNPLYDNGETTILAAKVLVDLMGMLAKVKGFI